MEPNEKIQLDDITFDDVIGGDGVETTAIDEIVSPKEEVVEQEIESSKEDDLEDLSI